MAKFVVDTEKFGERLRKVREQRGYTREALSELLDVHWTYIEKLEKGKRYPSFAMLVKLLTILEVSADFLLGLSDFPEPKITNISEHVKEKLEECEKYKAFIEKLKDGLSKL